jgi:hypothetical protein
LSEGSQFYRYNLFPDGRNAALMSYFFSLKIVTIQSDWGCHNFSPKDRTFPHGYIMVLSPNMLTAQGNY